MQLTPEQEAAFRKYLADEQTAADTREEFERVADPIRAAMQATGAQASESAKALYEAMGTSDNHVQITHGGKVYAFSKNGAWQEDAYIVSNDVKVNTP